MNTISEVIITIEEKCMGCNKCIATCPVEANFVYMKNGQSKVKVDYTKCIYCGACIGICDHDARSYYDDTEKFFNDVINGEKISVIVAPAIRTNFKDYKKLFTYLKLLGVNLIYDVSFGADISTLAYLKYLDNKNIKPLITSPCLPIVNYIQKYAPNLIERLAPVHSPMVCTAIYLKKYKDVNDSIAFLSPCIGKIGEINDENTFGYIKYNVTFNRLEEYLQKNNINLENYEDNDFDNIDCGQGVIYSKPGGLKENIEYYLPDIWIKLIHGKENAYEYLLSLEERVDKDAEFPVLLDILNCTLGCNKGTGTCKDICEDHIERIMRELKQKKAKDISKSISLISIDKKIEQIKFEIDINEFTRKYSNKSDTISKKIIYEEEIEKIFYKLNKISKEERNINCLACGYGSCESFVRAIIEGKNHLNNCLFYNQRELSKELHRAAVLQRQRLATKLPFTEKVNLEILYIPATTVSGDFFNFYAPNDHTLIGLLGDVSGKGLSAALSISALNVLFYNIEAYAKEPIQILNYFNSEVGKYLGEEYVAACCFIFDFLNKKLKVASAGINKFSYQSKDLLFTEKILYGPFLGMLNDGLFDQEILYFNIGDRFYFYTDGLEDILGNVKNIERLKTLSSIKEQKKFLEGILSNLSNLKDDSTLIAIEIK